MLIDLTFLNIRFNMNIKGGGFARVCTQMTQHGWGDALYIKS